MGNASDNNPPDIVERTFDFGVRIKRLCAYLRDELRKERHLAGQLERAGTAVGALVEEAQGAESRKDFIHKMSIAHKEAREANYWLRQLQAGNVITKTRLDDLTDESRQLKLILAAIINTARRNLEGDPPSDDNPQGDPPGDNNPQDSSEE